MTKFITAAKGPKDGTVTGFTKWVWGICSIFFPGITQIIYGILFGCDVSYILVGILLLCLAPLLVGFIWSIIWGVFAIKGGVVEKSAELEEDATAAPAPATTDAAPAVAI